MLPPSLEVWCVDQDGYIGDAGYESLLKIWLMDILRHKNTCFSLLRSIVLVESDDHIWNWDNYEEVLKLLERL